MKNIPIVEVPRPKKLADYRLKEMDTKLSVLLKHVQIIEMQLGQLLKK